MVNSPGGQVPQHGAKPICHSRPAAMKVFRMRELKCALHKHEHGNRNWHEACRVLPAAHHMLNMHNANKCAAAGHDFAETPSDHMTVKQCSNDGTQNQTLQVPYPAQHGVQDRLGTRGSMQEKQTKAWKPMAKPGDRQPVQRRAHSGWAH